MNVNAAAQWMEGRKAAMIANYETLGLKASGAWAQSLNYTVEQTSTGLKLVMKGAKHTGIMTDGRKPNSDQSPEKLKAWVGWAGSTIIADWCKAKGITASPYAIAYKVAREGIKVPNQHNDGSLLTGIITDETVKELLNMLKIGIASDIKENFKKV